jgi:hypothetical protein
LKHRWEVVKFIPVLQDRKQERATMDTFLNFRSYKMKKFFLIADQLLVSQ